MNFPTIGTAVLSLTNSKQAIYIHIDSLLKKEKGFEQEIQLFFKNLQKIPKHHTPKGLIIDLTTLKPFPIQSILFFNDWIIPKILQIGIENIAIIKPKNVFAQFSLEDTLERVLGEDNKFLKHLHIKLFEHKEQAKNWMKY